MLHVEHCMEVEIVPFLAGQTYTPEPVATSAERPVR